MNEGIILLVEDDENDVFFFQRAAGRAGVTNRLQVVSDGREAIDYLAGNGSFSERDKHALPGLIVLDLNLPHRNGLDVLRWIRANPSTETVIVVVFTSSSAERDVHEAYLLGANSYVIKPSNPDQVADVLSAIKIYWLTTNHAASPEGSEPSRLEGGQ
jgi:CheY-like chemotaxis protein